MKQSTRSNRSRMSSKLARVAVHKTIRSSGLLEYRLAYLRVAVDPFVSTAEAVAVTRMRGATSWWSCFVLSMEVRTCLGREAPKRCERAVAVRFVCTAREDGGVKTEDCILRTHEQRRTKSLRCNVKRHHYMANDHEVLSMRQQREPPNAQTRTESKPTRGRQCRMTEPNHAP